MRVTGTILRVEQGRAGITLIIQTGMGLRGVEIDAELWADIARDFELTGPDEMVGWAVEYDPAHGDLDITGPGDDAADA
jgi:hypothetical protein